MKKLLYLYWYIIGCLIIFIWKLFDKKYHLSYSELWKKAIQSYWRLNDKT
jgi:hypothetical protein